MKAPGLSGTLIVLPAVILEHRLELSFMTTMPSKLVRIRREDLLKAISSDAELTIGIMNILAANFIRVYEEFRADNRAAPWKLCNLLLSLADKHGADYDGKVLIKLRYSQQMMADYLHVNRTTVARTIKQLTDAGLLERVNNYYCIRSLDRLQRYMERFDTYVDEAYK